MLKLKPTLILVLFCVLIRSEAEGAIRKRWIQPLAFGQEVLLTSFSNLSVLTNKLHVLAAYETGSATPRG